MESAPRTAQDDGVDRWIGDRALKRRDQPCAHRCRERVDWGCVGLHDRHLVDDLHRGHIPDLHTAALAFVQIP